MDKKKQESLGLLWACFINWINTLEKVGGLQSSPDQVRDKRE